MALMTPDSDNRVLLISRIGCPPPYEGNRTRVQALVREISALGYAVHFAGIHLSDQERAATEPHVDRWVGNFVVPESVGGLTRFGARVFRKLSRVSGGLARSEESVDDGFYAPWLTQAKALQRKHRYRRVIVSYVFFSKFLDAFRGADVRAIDTHDSFSNRKERLSKDGIADYWHSFSAAEEARGLRRASRLIAIQAPEAALFRQMPRAPSVYEVGHFLNEEAGLVEQVGAIGGGAETDVGLIGSRNPINRHAAAWLLDEVWPSVLERNPGARLVVAGTVCTGLPAQGSVLALGPVDDLASVYRRCGFMINPVQVGTGLKIKTVEALSFGRCVVTTPTGAEGVEDLIGKGIIVCNDADAFVTAVTDLLQNPDKAVELGRRGLAEIKGLNKFSRDQLKEVLSIGRPTAPPAH